ncbi:hypothetical protein N0V85_006141 [Neurospora sp. IMI 360204]|nr:hypothetical protein N0V85_006141 [Neurospora sp. IMI 360204]
MEDLFADLYPQLPLYTPTENLPPAYTPPTPATSANTSTTEPDVTEPETEPAMPVPLDTFLTLELPSRLVRCIKVTLGIIRSDGDGQDFYEEILQVSGVLERYLERVTTTEETKEEAKELVKLARQCASSIWEYGKREEMVARMPQAALGDGEKQNRIKRELEAVDKRLLGKDFLGTLWYVPSSVVHVPTSNQER